MSGDVEDSLSQSEASWQTEAQRRREARARQVALRETGDALVQPWGRDDDRLLAAAERHLTRAGDHAERLRRRPEGRAPADQITTADQWLRKAHALTRALDRRRQLGGLSRLERHRALDELEALDRLAGALPAQLTRPGVRTGLPAPEVRQLAAMSTKEAKAHLRVAVARVADVEHPRELLRLAADLGPLVKLQKLTWQCVRDALLDAARRAHLDTASDQDGDALRRYIVEGLSIGQGWITSHAMIEALVEAGKGRA